MLVTKKGPPCLTQPDCPMGREPALKAGGLPSRLGSSFGREGVPKPASPSPADGCDEMLTVTEVAGPGARTARRGLTPPRRDACPPRGRHAAPSAAAGRRAAVARQAPDAEAARRFSCPPGTLVALPLKLAGRRWPRTRHSGRGQPGFPVGEARGRPRRCGDLGFGEGEVGSWLRTGRDVQVVGPCPARGRMPTPRPAVPRRPRLTPAAAGSLLGARPLSLQSVPARGTHHYVIA